VLKVLKDKNLVDTIVEYKRIKMDIEELQKGLKECEAVLKDEMVNRNTDEIIIDIHKVTNKEYTRQSFDVSRFKEEQPKNYFEYLTETVYNRFQVK
jgi:predicted phage-related endonuclease